MPRRKKGPDPDAVPPKPWSPAQSKNGTGRHSGYHEGVPGIVKKLIDEPFYATDEQCCIVLGIDRATFYRWKHRYPEFRDAIRRSKEQVVNAVAGAMVKAAMGYSVDAVKIMTRPTTVTETKTLKNGKKVTKVTKSVEFVPVQYQEHIPPNEKAGEFILTNFASKQFQKSGIDEAPPTKTPEEVEERRKRVRAMVAAIEQNAREGGQPFFPQPDEVPTLPAPITQPGSK